MLRFLQAYQQTIVITCLIVNTKILSSAFRPVTRQRPAISFTSRIRLGTTRSMQSSDAPISSEPPDKSNSNKLRFVDIGANLLDERFTAGTYRGTFRHDPDLDCIMQRAIDVGVKRIVLTAGTVVESCEAVRQAREWNRQWSPHIQFTCTVGVHPTRCQQVFEPNNTDTHAQSLLQELLDIARDGMSDGTVVAIGEIGLDYDRLEFCPADVQKRYLLRQLEVLAANTGLPLFLHNRSVGDDLYNILKDHQHLWKKGGVAHSFDDSLELAMKFIDDLGLYIGLNGCSLRTDENLETVSEIPLDHILLETDCPYCEVRKTHAGYRFIQTHFSSVAEKKFEAGMTVKNRQEPCHVVQVAEIVAGCKTISIDSVADACYKNSLKLFGWHDE